MTRERGLVIAIDGPAASGKSTTARGVAESLGYCHLNSGQLYRAVAWAALRDGWSGAGSETVATRVETLDIALERRPPAYRVLLDGHAPGDELKDREVTGLSSRLARHPAVRERVLGLLRRTGRRGGVVCDGRDIGTVVFPEAELKVFLVASPAERARRRLQEHGESPTEEALRRETDRLRERDRADMEREISPLRRAEDAVEIDTTDLQPGQVVQRIVRLARERGTEGDPDGPQVDDHPFSA